MSTDRAREALVGAMGETEHTCECGHVRDEHDGECTIDDCRCLCFDRVPDGETR